MELFEQSKSPPTLEGAPSNDGRDELVQMKLPPTSNGAPFRELRDYGSRENAHPPVVVLPPVR